MTSSLGRKNKLPRPKITESELPSDSGRLLTIEEVAEKLHETHETVRRRARRGEMPFFKPFKRWLIREADYLAWEAEHHTKPNDSNPFDG